MEGRVSPSSVTGDSPKKEKDEEAATPSLHDAEIEDGQDCFEMSNLMEAVGDASQAEDNSAPVMESTSAAKEKSVSLAASFLHLTDSETDDEMEITESGNDFLHLTSSELESMEMNGMKEVLRMQGIWLFNWNRCAEVMLSSK